LLVLPAAAAFASRNAARALPRTPEAALAAALLAAAPGLVALGALFPALTTWGVVKTWRGVVLFWATPGVAGLMLAWALSRSILRQWAVADLFRASHAAGPRLAAAARRLGLNARELATTERECFVAGFLRPTVFVSRGALDGLDEYELNAALHHERAHIRGGDTRALFVLGLLRDLAPWGRSEALDAFLAAREARADREAARRAGRLDLASALLALARPGPCPAAVLPMAASDGLNRRLQALLEGEAPSPQGWTARTAGALGVNSLLASWPIVQFELCILFCSF
jgi:Zn-dependent protease with chaperone function